MIDDRDVWQAALLIVKRYGDEAMLEASERADQLLDEGDMAGAETWHRILNAIERLQAKAPSDGEKVH
jgi:triphosphoribosyl-dephospho-CoA synthetase